MTRKIPLKIGKEIDQKLTNFWYICTYNMHIRGRQKFVEKREFKFKLFWDKNLKVINIFS